MEFLLISVSHRMGIAFRYWLVKAHGFIDLSSVEVDRYSGKVVQVTKVIKPEGLIQVIVTVASLHFGTFGGLPTRILYVFIGLMPTVLLVTGLLNWRRGRSLGERREAALHLMQHPQAIRSSNKLKL